MVADVAVGEGVEITGGRVPAIIETNLDSKAFQGSYTEVGGIEAIIEQKSGF